MIRAIVLTGAAVLLSLPGKRSGRNRYGSMHSNSFTERPSFKQFELAAKNLKATTKKVDQSAAGVEAALKML